MMNCKNRPNHFYNSSLDASNHFTNPALPTSVIKLEPQDVTQDKIADQIEDNFAKGQLILKCLFGVFNSPKKQTKTIRLEVQ